MAESNILFDDIFTIKSIDAEGKKFDRGRGHTLITTFTYQRTQGSLLLYLVSRHLEACTYHTHLRRDGVGEGVRLERTEVYEKVAEGVRETGTQTKAYYPIRHHLFLGSLSDFRRSRLGLHCYRGRGIGNRSWVKMRGGHRLMMVDKVGKVREMLAEVHPQEDG